MRGDWTLLLFLTEADQPAPLPPPVTLPSSSCPLYSQLSAARDALGLPIHVSISGQAEAAEALSEAAEAEPLAPPLEQQGSVAPPLAGPAGAELATKKRKLTSAQSDTYKVGTDAHMWWKRMYG